MKVRTTKNTYGKPKKRVLGTVPVFSVPVGMSYRAHRSFRYQYWCRTELTEVFGTGIDVVPKIPKCSVPVWKSAPASMSFRTYRSVRYGYWCHTENTHVSGAGIDVLPKLSKYPVPVLTSYRRCRIVRYRHWCTELTEVSGIGNTGGMTRYVPYRTHPSLHAVQKSTLWIIN